MDEYEVILHHAALTLLHDIEKVEKSGSNLSDNEMETLTKAMAAHFEVDFYDLQYTMAELDISEPIVDIQNIAWRRLQKIVEFVEKFPKNRKVILKSKNFKL